jgi:dipeptidyl aminopeptidase/acylaminoacyl peptidase
VEWVEYDKEGHGWSLPETEVDWWTRVEAFLAKHIPPAK